MTKIKDSYGNLVSLPKNQQIQWRISGYAIVHNDNGHTYMVQSGSGLWHFPGGGIEIDEDLFSGIKREYREETGYQIKIEPQIYHFNEQRFYHTRKQEFYHSLQLFFIAHLVDKQPDMRFITGNDATRQSSWIDLHTLHQDETHETVRQLVRQLKNS